MDDKKNKLNILEDTYFPEIARGLKTTIRHFLYNLTHQEQMPTISYPEEKRKIPECYRGKHRLTVREDETPKCVACFLCATACPADCIKIEAGEYAGGGNEKYPVKYEIDLLRCVFCGLCVEACPCDAIRMDTGEYDLADYTRDKLILKKEDLMMKDLPDRSKENIKGSRK